jgi:hypothetical protein
VAHSHTADEGLDTPRTRRTLRSQRAAVWNIETRQTANPRETARKRLSKALSEAFPKDVREQTEDDAEIQDVGTLIDFDTHDDEDLPSSASKSSEP